MIDEALYKQAAEELNSERRRPHVWARACALANDDHDEARYLYTNLRVEELIAEGRTGVPPSSESSTDTDDLSLSLEPIDTASPDDSSGDSPIASVRPGVDTGGGSSVESLLPGARDEGTMRPVSEHARAVLDLDDEASLDLDPDELQRLNEADGGSVSAIDGRHLPDAVAATSAGQALAARDEALADADANAAPDVDADESSAIWTEVDTDASGSALVGADDGGDDRQLSPAPRSEDPPAGGSPEELDWLDEAYREERRALAESPEPDCDDTDPDELTRELRRQAEELPGGRGSGTVIRHESGPDRVEQRGDIDSASALSGGAWADDDVASGARPDRPMDEPPDVSEGELVEESPVDIALTGATAGAAAAGVAPAAGAAHADDPAAAFAARGDEPLELAEDGAGDEEYAVFSRDGGRAVQAVRQGGSWAALFFTLPWLVYRRLIGTALIYLLLAVAIVAGLLVTGLAWYETGADTALITKVAAVGFGVLALVGLLIVPFRSANHWREDKLERRGFELVAYVRARGPRRALALVRQAMGEAA